MAPPDVTGPVNIGNPREFTMLELANKVIELTGSTLEVAKHPLPTDDPTQRCPTSARQGAARWQPKVRSKKGLCLTIDYFRKSCRRNDRGPLRPDDPAGDPVRRRRHAPVAAVEER